MLKKMPYLDDYQVEIDILNYDLSIKADEVIEIKHDFIDFESDAKSFDEQAVFIFKQAYYMKGMFLKNIVLENLDILSRKVEPYKIYEVDLYKVYADKILKFERDKKRLFLNIRSNSIINQDRIINMKKIAEARDLQMYYFNKIILIFELYNNFKLGNGNKTVHAFVNEYFYLRTEISKERLKDDILYYKNRLMVDESLDLVLNELDKPGLISVGYIDLEKEFKTDLEFISGEIKYCLNKLDATTFSMMDKSRVRLMLDSGYDVKLIRRYIKANIEAEETRRFLESDDSTYGKEEDYEYYRGLAKDSIAGIYERELYFKNYLEVTDIFRKTGNLYDFFKVLMEKLFFINLDKKALKMVVAFSECIYKIYGVKDLLLFITRIKYLEVNEDVSLKSSEHNIGYMSSDTNLYLSGLIISVPNLREYFDNIMYYFSLLINIPYYRSYMNRKDIYEYYIRINLIRDLESKKMKVTEEELNNRIDILLE